MRTKVIEATNGFNWGKFLLARFEEEWALRSTISTDYNIPLPMELGWTREHIWVMDLQTGEGALFRAPGFVPADLKAHAIWVCPMFEPFLVWLYKQDLSDLDALPSKVEMTLEESRPALYGYRRKGPSAAARKKAFPPVQEPG